MRRYIVVAVTAVGAVSLLVQLAVNRPTGSFERQPAGWASSEASTDLAGNLAAFHEVAMPVQLSVNDYARITAYASAAYMAARYGDTRRTGSSRDEQAGGTGSEEDGTAAFYAVVREMMPDPAFHERLPQATGSGRADRAATMTIQRAATDGYSENWPPEPVRFVSPLDLGPDKKQYSWGPVMGNGPELERTWGELTPLNLHDCSVAAPPVDSFADLVAAAARVKAASVAMAQHEYRDGLATLGFAYTGGYWQRTEPVRIWLQLVATAALDAKLPTERSDRMLATAAAVFHDTIIAAWDAKFTYLLAHPLAVDRTNNPYQNAQVPSYPSEISAIAAAGAEILDDYTPKVRPRVELPGSVISAPTTRVLPDSGAAVREFSAVAQMMGLAYDFDTTSGEQLGACVARTALAGGQR
jgi:hypothetical protein